MSNEIRDDVAMTRGYDRSDEIRLAKQLQQVTADRDALAAALRGLVLRPSLALLNLTSKSWHEDIDRARRILDSVPVVASSESYDELHRRMQQAAMRLSSIVHTTKDPELRRRLAAIRNYLRGNSDDLYSDIERVERTK